MKLKPYLFILALLITTVSFGQSNCLSGTLNGQTIALPCGATCTPVSFSIPHLRSTNSYGVKNIPFTPFPYTTQAGNELSCLYQDDKYGPLISLPFPVCFYGANYTSAVVGSNGLITFDPSNASTPCTTSSASCDNSYTCTSPIPFSQDASGGQCLRGGIYYPRASFMGMFTDLDPESTTSPPDRKIEWRVEGTAPCRRLVVSFYDVGMYGSGSYSSTGTNCNSLNPTIFEMVVWETTNFCEVYIKQKQCNSSTSGGGQTIMGVQNWNQDQAVAAPGKNATIWNENNKAYQFYPNGGSLYVHSQLCTLGGAVLATTTPADTSTTIGGILNVNFPNFCPPVDSALYIIKTTWNTCTGAPPFVVSDTVTIKKKKTDGTASAATTGCNATTGCITVTATLGQAPFTYSLDGGPFQASNVFCNVALGSHIVTIKDNQGCTKDIPVTLSTGASLTATTATTKTSSCAPTGTITVTAGGSSATPYGYQLNGGPSQPGNVFSGLAAGTYAITITDAAGCNMTVNATVASFPAVTATVTTTPSGCAPPSGTITTTILTGTAPFTYQLDGGAFGPVGSFTGVPSGSHTVVIKDSTGCTDTLTANVAFPTPITATASTYPSGCNPTGKISVTVTGGGVGPFNYKCDGSSYQPGNLFTALAAGPHIVIIKDAEGCTDTLNVNVPALPPMAATASSTASGCVPSGTITVTVTVGVSPFTYQLDGGGFGASNAFSPVGSGSHTVIIKDSTGCYDTLTVNVAAPPPLTATYTTMPSGCNPTGSISVTPTSGIAPYTYTLDGVAQSSANITSVSAGPHVVIMKDSQQCTDTINVTVPALPQMSATATSTYSGCTVATGTITANVSVGVAPFTYKVDAGAFQLSNSFAGIASGAHTIIIKDATGCYDTLQVTVATPPPFTASSATMASGCNPTGSITVTVPGGQSAVAPYTYSLDGAAPQNSNVFTAVGAGTHSIIIKDSLGCKDTISVSVSPLPAMAASASSTYSGCTVATGTITATVSVGVAPFTYKRDAGGFQPSNFFSNVASGLHTIIIRDSTGCYDTVTVNAGTPPPYTATATHTASGCNPTGSITVVIPAGGSSVAPYTYVLDGVTTQNSPTFNNVPVGPHGILITDSLGCTTNVLDTVPALPHIATSTPVATPSGCTIAVGTIQFSVTVGVAPYSYSVDNGPFTAPSSASPYTATGLNANPHTIVIKDATGCYDTLTVTVPQTVAITATTGSTNTSCLQGATNGSITVHPQTGVAPFQFRIGAAGAWQTDSIFINLAAGPYTFYVQDAGGCISQAINGSVIAGLPLTATDTTSAVICNGGATGSATLFLSSNATLPYTYSMSSNFTPSQSNPTFNGLAAGSHQFYFKDGAGCSDSITIIITEPALLKLDTLVTPVLCNGTATGSITLSGQGGVLPYQYKFDALPYGTTTTFNVAAGSYTASIKDANGCITTIPTIIVNQPSALIVDSLPTSAATCNGGADGQIRAYASGGTPPYLYRVGNDPYQTSNTFPATPGVYYVTVQDANGCTKIDTATVALNNNLTYTAHSLSSPICEGSSVDIGVNGYTNANSFTWTPTVKQLTANGDSVTVNPTQTTMYYVNYTLGLCSGNDSFLVQVWPAPLVKAHVRDSVICVGLSTSLIGGVRNNVVPLTYEWTPHTYLTGNLISDSVFVDHPGVGIKAYTLRVREQNGCWSLTDTTVYVNVTPPITITFSPGDTTAYIGDTLRVHAMSAGVHYTWTPDDDLVYGNTNNPIIFVDRPQVYKVDTWTDQGCTGTAYYHLNAYRGPDIYVPDAFTPNKDGKNDLMRPVCVGVKQLNYFRIFNRWGELVYEYKGEKDGPVLFDMIRSNIGWDGTIKGHDATTASFIWVAEGITKEGRIIQKKGVFTLIR